MTAETSSIPIVDFAGWNPDGSTEQRTKIAEQLTEGCRNVGFVYIINHRVSPQRLAQAFEWSKKLFDLKLEQKMLAPHPSGHAVHRGYSWPGLEKVSNAMGDEDDADLTKKLRQISDVKVHPFKPPSRVMLKFGHRRATRSVVKATRTSPINGFLKMFFLVFEAS